MPFTERLGWEALAGTLSEPKPKGQVFFSGIDGSEDIQKAAGEKGAQALNTAEKVFFHKFGAQFEIAWRRMIERLSLGQNWVKPKSPIWTEGKWISKEEWEKKPNEPEAYDSLLTEKDNIGEQINDWLYDIARRHSTISERDIWTSLLDFRLGPSTFLKEGKGFNASRPVPPALRQDLGNFQPQQQTVFLSGSGRGHFSGLDEFAKAVADGKLDDGVHLVAGVRGSGKSTLLNRIELFCRNWDPNLGRPFVIRFDLGSAADPQKFLRSLLATICREAVEHTRGMPFTKGPSLAERTFATWGKDFDFHCRNFGWRSRFGFKQALGLVGTAGRWCAANYQWACVMMLILCVWICWNKWVPAQVNRHMTIRAERFSGLAKSLSDWRYTTNHISPKQPTGQAKPVPQERAANPLTELTNTLSMLKPQELDAAISWIKTNEVNITTNNSGKSVTNLLIPVRTGSLLNFGDFIKTNHESFNNWGINLSNYAAYLKGQTKNYFAVDPQNPVSPAATNSASSPASKEEDIGASLFEQKELIFFVIGMVIIVAGYFHRQRSRALEVGTSKGPDSHKPEDGLATFFSAISILSLLGFTIVVAAMASGCSFFLGRPSLGYFLATGLTGVVSFWAAQKYMPGWWLLKAKCKGMRVELRGKEEYPTGKEKLGGSLAGLAELLLPVPSDAEDYQDMDRAFLEQQVKRLLHRVTSEFGRTVILIDDVDALPPDQYRELLRLLRPPNKVAGVTCVVTVPLLFYHQLYCTAPNDLHSTAQGVYVLGSPKLFKRNPTPKTIFPYFSPDLFPLRPDFLDNLPEEVNNLLRTQLKIPAATSPKFIANISRLWSAAPGSHAAKSIKIGLERFGSSRRELLRESLRMIDFKSSQNQDPVPFENHFDEKTGCIVTRYIKNRFEQAENSLDFTKRP